MPVRASNPDGARCRAYPMPSAAASARDVHAARFGRIRDDAAVRGAVVADSMPSTPRRRWARALQEPRDGPFRAVAPLTGRCGARLKTSTPTMP
jgi:hypothetical protein